MKSIEFDRKKEWKNCGKVAIIKTFEPLAIYSFVIYYLTKNNIQIIVEEINICSWQIILMHFDAQYNTIQNRLLILLYIFCTSSPNVNKPTNIYTYMYPNIKYAPQT